MADLTHAASHGHVDTVLHLLARGLPIDAGSQDFTSLYCNGQWAEIAHAVLVTQQVVYNGNGRANAVIQGTMMAGLLCI